MRQSQGILDVDRSATLQRRAAPGAQPVSEAGRAVPEVVFLTLTCSLIWVKSWKSVQPHTAFEGMKAPFFLAGLCYWHQQVVCRSAWRLLLAAA